MGYASGGVRNHAAQAKRGIARKVAHLRGKDIQWVACSYETHTPRNTLVYCDPPYAQTKCHYQRSGFSTEAFWETVRKWSDPSLGNVVVVSELSAPDDFKSIWHKEHNSSPNNVPDKKRGRDVMVDHLYMHVGT